MKLRPVVNGIGLFTTHAPDRAARGQAGRAFGAAIGEWESARRTRAEEAAATSRQGKFLIGCVVWAAVSAPGREEVGVYDFGARKRMETRCQPLLHCLNLDRDTKGRLSWRGLVCEKRLEAAMSAERPGGGARAIHGMIYVAGNLLCALVSGKWSELLPGAGAFTKSLIWPVALDPVLLRAVCRFCASARVIGDMHTD